MSVVDANGLIIFANENPLLAIAVIAGFAVVAVATRPTVLLPGDAP